VSSLQSFPKSSSSSSLAGTPLTQSSNETPCRRLFVRNIRFETPFSVLRKKFESFGNIQSVCDLIPKRGICFLTFFDLRAAQMAHRMLNETDIDGRKIQIHYSLPKDDDSVGKDGKKKSGRQDSREDHQDQGTLIVNLRNSRGPLESKMVQDYFESFGPVASVYEGSHSLEKRVAFFDTRDCKQALKQFQETRGERGLPFLDGFLELELTRDNYLPLGTESVMSTSSNPAGRMGLPEKGQSHERTRFYEDTREERDEMRKRQRGESSYHRREEESGYPPRAQQYPRSPSLVSSSSVPLSQFYANSTQFPSSSSLTSILTAAAPSLSSTTSDGERSLSLVDTLKRQQFEQYR